MDDSAVPEILTTRRERRLARRLEQERTHAAPRRFRIVRRVFVWIVGIGLLVGVGWGAFVLSGSVVLPNDGAGLAVPVSVADHGNGRVDAPVALVEYSDYQCPACASFHSVIKRALSEPNLKNKVRFVYRNFPLTQLHKNAQLSAQAAEAAALQDAFWEYHDLLFENQQKWSVMPNAGAREQFVEYAEKIGLDTVRFAKDIDSEIVKDRIAADVAGAHSSAVDATPTFFINGARMEQPRGYEQFVQFIAAGIGGAVTPTP